MVTFIVDGKELVLTMRDDNGIDWSADFIGNTAHGMEIDEEGRYIASRADYEWWDNMIVAYQDMQAQLKDYQQRYGYDTVEEWLRQSAAWERDLEDQPSSVLQALRELDEEE